MRVAIPVVQHSVEFATGDPQLPSDIFAVEPGTAVPFPIDLLEELLDVVLADEHAFVTENPSDEVRERIPCQDDFLAADMCEHVSVCHLVCVPLLVPHDAMDLFIAIVDILDAKSHFINLGVDETVQDVAGADVDFVRHFLDVTVPVSEE